ncbi:MAG: AAA family ATPase [Desulfobacterales bacterium]
MLCNTGIGLFENQAFHAMKEDRRYITHFHLVAKPFEESCGPRFVWLGDKQLENLAYLKVGIEEGKGILLLVGENGSGKSVLVDRLLPVIAGDLKSAVVRETGIPVEQFFDLLIEAFGLDRGIATKGEFLFHFRECLKAEHAAGKRLLLVLENAELQADEILEQVRLFSNMEEKGAKLINILLVGTSRLLERIESFELRALFQRCAVRRWVEPFSVEETGAYIRHRLMAAGSFLEIFTPKAVGLVQRLSGGAPRHINRVCEHALKRGGRAGLQRIDEKPLRAYARELQDDLPPAGKPDAVFKKWLERLKDARKGDVSAR